MKELKIEENLKTTQLFFKDKLIERLANDSKGEYNNDFNLMLHNYDLYDADIERLTNLIIATDKLTTLTIRLSDTLIDDKITYKLLKKISLKRQFKTLSFYIKYLDENKLKLFYEFMSKINESLTELRIQVKFKDKPTEEKIFFNIIENLNKNENINLEKIIFSDCRFTTKDTASLLNNFLIKNKEKIASLYFLRCFFENNYFNIDISNTKIAAVISSNINTLYNLPKEKFILIHNNISIYGIEKISNLLLENKTIVKLDLSYNYIGDDGCEILSESIKANNSITTLNLAGNNILNRGCESIAKALLINKSIKKLNFCDNSIENQGLESFVNILKNLPENRFTKINFSSNYLNENGYEILGDLNNKHTGINSLVITTANTKIKEESQKILFGKSIKMNHIKKIYMYNIDLKEETCPYLNDVLLNNKNIQEISIVNNKNLLSQGIEKLSKGIAHNTKIKKISLPQCNIGDEGCEILAQALFNNIDIEEIILDDNKIKEKGIKAISEKLLGKISLKKLVLGHNLINAKGAFFIGESLKQANGIEIILLNSNDIKDEGCEFIAKGLENNNSLIELNLENNDIHNKGISELAKILKTKEKFMQINLSSNKITEIESDLYELIGWVNQIKIADNPLSSSGVSRLFQGTEDNKFIKCLRFKNNNTDKFDFKCFNKNIKEIDLSYNAFLNLSLIKHIISLNKLSILNLSSNGIRDENLDTISNYIIESKSQLKKFILHSNYITEIGSKYICKLIELSLFLKELNLASNPLKTKGIINICNSLQNNANNIIENLLLNMTGCNDYSINAIYEMLINKNNLIILGLHGNKFTNKGIDKLLSSLRVNKTLKQLSIGDNKLNDENAFANLVNYLKFNQTLKILEIKTSKINDKIKLNKLYNSKLISLSLVDNNLSFSSLCHLGQYFAKNKNINEVKCLLNKPTKDEIFKLQSCNSHIIFN